MKIQSGRRLWAITVALPFLFGCPTDPELPPTDTLSVAAVLADDGNQGFARALEPRDMIFPADHGPHPSFRTEWWYLTGNLQNADQKPFGYQVTFFRSSLSPEPRRRASVWAADDLYMAHFAVTDGDGKQFHSFERFARGAAGLAGARAQPFRVWLEDWELTGVLADGETGAFSRLDLELGAAGIAIDLELLPRTPVVLNGDRGLSAKGREPGSASYYYSLPRLESRGTIRLGAKVETVRGLSWMDREWSSGLLEESQVGWDWFALHFMDDRGAEPTAELMFYRLRREDGSTDFSGGTWIDAAGVASPLGPGDVELTVGASWRSADSEITYPAGWRLRIASRGIDCTIEPVLPEQELRHSFVYWEGAVRGIDRGKAGTRPVLGYVELTGYGREPSGRR